MYVNDDDVYFVAFHRMYETIDRSEQIDTFRTFGAFISLFHVTLGEFEVRSACHHQTDTDYRAAMLLVLVCCNMCTGML